MIRIFSYLFVWLFFLGFLRWPIAAHAAGRPNILLIVSDDQGYNDLGVLNSDILTPALNRLAKEGTRLTDFYVAWPACTPSRAALLTGRYPQRNGIYDMIRNEAPDYGHKYPPAEYEVTFERIGGMDLREVFLPRLLQNFPEGTSRYKSAIYGKWDLGSLKRFLPTSRGFDDFYGLVNTGIDYYTHERYGVPSMFRNLQRTEEDKGTYCTYLFEREALRFLEEGFLEEKFLEGQTTKPKGEQKGARAPFFLYVPFNAPHSSSALEPEIRTSVQAPDKFKQMYPPVEPEFREVPRFRYATPARVVTPAALTRDYRAAVTCMDASIGKMLTLLERKGVLDNTIVIFFSDNGGGGGADNSPLRGHKAQMWEGGIRVPCLVRWPDGGVPPGAVCHEFLSSLELFPSLASATGATLPRDVVLDGFDWWSVLRGQEKSPRQEMFWQRKDSIGARVGHWKWVDRGSHHSPEQRGGLFDLKADIGEQHDLSQARPEVLAMIKTRHANWRKEMEAAEPRGPFRDY